MPMFKLFKKIIGTAQGRLLKRYTKIVDEVNKWEEKFQSLSQEELTKKTTEFKRRYKDGESLEKLLPEAYGVVKNQCRRLCGSDVDVSGYEQKWDMVPYDVQILGAIAMFYGSIAEMQTGEGKTLTASMPLYIHAITGKPVHLVTVNDYLAKRDCQWIGTIFTHLGLSVASLTNDVPLHERKKTYAADIVYGTSSEFGFDYLRDNSMSMSKEEQVQRGHYFTIIDEVDSILIDEARTPLIISGPSASSNQMYDELKDPVAKIVRAQRDFCNRLASEAKRTIDSLSSKEKRTKAESEELNIAFRKLWQVHKGTPHNKVLKRMRENPDYRAKIDNWETFYYSDQNKEEKAEILSELFLIVDEKGSEYELTDKGINLWGETNNHDDFVMFDLGYEYAKIDESDLSDSDKMQKKIELREEDAKRKERSHNVRQLFRAHLLMEKDIDYIVQDQKIVIIDENTGRPQPGRRFSDGLHQSIEAKESVEIQGETQTYATITLQNYFRMYDRLSGMTGTAITEANEFKEIYKLEVLEIPTYRPCQRIDHDDQIYMTEREKYIAILKEIQEIHANQCPILIGTESVEISEKLSRILKQNKLPHQILNAKNHEHEANIIANAGEKGAITLATNMAGRGTDIKLKGDVSKLGGLHVIGTTRHQSRRIDRQLRGRSGRLGDPGASKFFVSFEDSLMRLFASPRMTALLQRFRPPEGEPISAKVLNKSIETAQKRVEQRNYTIRKHTLEYDDVMNKQRQEIYTFRNDILYMEDPKELALELLENTLLFKTQDLFNSNLWNPEEFRLWLMEHFPVSIDENLFKEEHIDISQIEKLALEKITNAFEQKIQAQKERILEIRPDADKVDTVLAEVLRNIMLRRIDQLWQEHLLNIDHLRSDVHLRAVGQKDPLMEFKHEAFSLFEEFSQRLRLMASQDLFRFEMVPPKEQAEPSTPSLADLELHRDQSFTDEIEEQPEQASAKEKGQTLVSDKNRVERNDPCPCGSGKKYKKCCGIKATV